MATPGRPPRVDVAVIGAGIIGCAIARELSRYALQSVLIDAESEVGAGASKANSGIIHAGHHAGPGTLKGELEWRGNEAWEALARDLPFGFRRVGDLTCAFDEHDRATLRELHAVGLRRGVSGLEFWDASRLRALEPNLSHDIVEALHAPTAAVVNPYEACFALAESAACNGVTLLLERRVTAITRDDGAFTLTLTPTDASGAPETLRARFVVDAAGLHADSVADMVGAGGFTIRARKGEEVLLDKRLQGFVQRIVFPCPRGQSKGILLIPTFDGTLMIGPTATWAAKDDLTTTEAGIAEIFAGARRLAPGIGEADTIAEFAGLRAVADGEDFIIGASRVAGFVLAAGMQSPALTAAPAVAELVLDALRDDGLPLEPRDHFVPTLPTPLKLADLPDSARRAAHARDSAYAHVVCRCEDVSEGEIRDAILRGARTLDGIKFRTRAGMGRCQGGFCTWPCLRLLHEHAGLPPERVRKGSGASTFLAPDREGTP
jgi:glycerol-3-phosphate dehydrogenase